MLETQSKQLAPESPETLPSTKSVLVNWQSLGDDRVPTVLLKEIDSTG